MYGIYNKLKIIDEVPLRNFIYYFCILNINIRVPQAEGSSFEQISFLTYNAIILELIKQHNETAEPMFERNADLE
ncbi:hypothetical protein OSO01_17390 [Oceanobacillus sojae]|uniref:Uncharacterized protein n=1 Tax=Oceanobacillus sojae TaxID=582851 RepID=A0A511ZHT3_9BACI|nr:hypothetical protein OSO01_17390 [Oceanobacillus sojae]